MWWRNPEYPAENYRLIPYTDTLLTFPAIFHFQLKVNSRNGSFTRSISSATLVSDEWQHVAGSYDSTTGEMKLYRNGEVKKQLNGRAFPIATQGYIRVGSRDADSQSRYATLTYMLASIRTYRLTYRQTHTYMLTYIHTYAHTDIHTYLHRYTHAYIHTHIHT